MELNIFILFAVICFMSIIRNVHSDKEFCKPIRKYISEEDNDGPVHVFEEYIYIPIRFFTEVTLRGFESEDADLLPFRVDDFTLEDYEDSMNTFDDEEDEEEKEGVDVIIDEEQEKILNCGNTERGVSRPIEYYKWPDGIVHYTYLPNGTRFQESLQLLMDKLSETSCVSFKEADDKSPNQVQIFRSDTKHCGASVGKLNIKVQNLKLTGTCVGIIKEAFHYLLHILGFFHEMQREDYEEFVLIHRENIKHSALPQFTCKEGSTTWNTPYDFDSALHFDFDTYSKNRRLTMTPMDPLVEADMYNSEKPSFNDLVAVNRMYSCEEKCTDSSFACKNDGFKTGNAEGKCICICPKGFKGDQCEDASPLPACNEKFTNREGNIVSPSEFYEDKKCVYWLQAPKSKHIALQFDKFELAPRSKNGLCETEYLNVRSVGIHSDVPGRRFCGAELHNHWFQSRFEDIILIYKTGSEKSDGFHGSYFVIH